MCCEKYSEVQLHADNTETYICESVINKDAILQADLHGQKLSFII